MAPKVSEEYLEARKQEILRAAVRAFSRHGFHGATLEHIREESGLSRGAVYHYFKSKEEMIEALQAGWASADAAFSGTVAMEQSVPEQLAAFVDATFSRLLGLDMRDANRLGVLLWAESLLNSEIGTGQATLVDAWRGQVRGMVEQAQRQGYVDPNLDPSAVTFVLGSLILGFTMQIAWRVDEEAGRAGSVVRAMLTGRFRAGVKA